MATTLIIVVIGGSRSRIDRINHSDEGMSPANDDNNNNSDINYNEKF